MQFEKTFGETIKKLRDEKQLTLREVAKVLDIDTSMLAKVEKNTRKPSKLLIQKISEFFNVSSKDLTISFLSDEVVYQIKGEEDYANEVLKVAGEKVEYLKMQRNS